MDGQETIMTEDVAYKMNYELQLEGTGEPTTKQMIWERKLLDFTLRNNLLNTRLGRKVVPFITFGIEHLEDHLQNNEDYVIIPSPGKKIEPNDEGMYDSPHQAAEYQNYVSEMIKDNKIASYLTETELQGALTYVYRTARTSLEENGANSLFLALGMLRWFENSKSEQPRYAPILLLPVDIIRKSGSKFIIRKRDEDIIMNITLVELLRQNFSINLEMLKELPKDESGVDVQKIFSIIRLAIADQKNWCILEEAMLGLFSFNKFVMWNDIHSNADLLAENAIVSSLIAQCDKQEPSEESVDARIIDKTCSPKDFSIPLDVDSSQMEAIVESGRGRTFILHGPPGTGKSQTITNMIANALYQGRRVLFVAEKMAALSVVQSRLEKIGLAPFCLELHSNKATKKHFLEQMDKVLNVTKIKEPSEYASKAKELFAQRKSLISYMDALHQKGDNGLSLYDCISEYLSISQEEIEDGLPERNALTADFIMRCRNQIEPLDTVLGIRNPQFVRLPFLLLRKKHIEELRIGRRTADISLARVQHVFRNVNLAIIRMRTRERRHVSTSVGIVRVLVHPHCIRHDIAVHARSHAVRNAERVCVVRSANGRQIYLKIPFSIRLGDRFRTSSVVLARKNRLRPTARSLEIGSTHTPGKCHLNSGYQHSQATNAPPQVFFVSFHNQLSTGLNIPNSDADKATASLQPNQNLPFFYPL